MRQKRIWIYILFILFLPSLQLHSLDNNRLNTLVKKRQWLALLHFQKGKSQIDDPSFFLSPKGMKDPKSELSTTIRHIQYNDREILCKYPARVYWLHKEVPKLFDDYNTTSCEKIEALLKDNPANHMTLVFPTAHVNSPASMFGHTFLRVDKDKNTPLLSQAINYAAQTGENNGLLFAYYGLTGGYKGYYSVLPYYKKIKEYAHMEQRDMWEYSLNLNHEEIRMLLYHLYELKGKYNKYYFFTKNCSYNLLWLLQVARSDSDLTSEFTYKAIPIDTIRAVEDEGFIDGVHFRPSQRKEMTAIIKRMKDVSIVKDFVKTYDLSLIENLNDQQKTYAIDLATHLLKYERSQNKWDKKTYIKTLMKLLHERSELPKIEDYSIKEPKNPLAGHKSSKITLYASGDKNFGFSIKPAFHDIYDLEDGFIKGAYINFFALDIQKYNKKNVQIEKFDLVSIASFSRRDDFFKPYSWSVDVGFHRVHKDKLYFKLGTGIGLTYGGDSFLVTMMLKPALFIRQDTKFSMKPQIGFVKNFSKVKIGAQIYKTYFSDGVEEKGLEGFFTYGIQKDMAFNLKLQVDKIAQKREQSVTCALFYYF